MSKKRMTIKDALARIEALERRCEELEKRQPVTFTFPEPKPAPFSPPHPHWFPEPWIVPQWTCPTRYPFFTPVYCGVVDGNTPTLEAHNE